MENKIRASITLWRPAYYNLPPTKADIEDLLKTDIMPLISDLKKSIREEIESKKDNVWGILCEMDTNIKSEKEYASDIVDEILSLKSLE